MRKITIIVVAFILTLIGSPSLYSQIVVQDFPHFGGLSGPSGIAIDPLDNIIISDTYITYSSGAPVRSIARKYSPAGNILWSAAQLTGSAQGLDVCVDGNGNSYVLAVYYASTPVQLVGGAQTHISNGGTDLLLAKYNAHGVLQWSKSFGGTEHEMSGKISCDVDGNIALIGHSESDSVSIDGNILTGSGAPGGLLNFIVKLTTQGNTLWATKVISNGQAIINDVSLDPHGHVNLSGGVTGSNYTLGGATNSLPANSSYMFATKLDLAGDPMWVKTIQIHSSLANKFNIASDTTGAVYVSGSYSLPVNFDGIILPPGPGNQHGFLVKYNNAGVQQWVKSVESGPQTIFASSALALDASGNLYFSGTFSGNAATVSVGDSVYSGFGLDDFLLIKYSSSGNINWSLHGGSSGNERVGGMAFDIQGNCFISGKKFSGGQTLSFGNYTSVVTGNFTYKVKTGNTLNRAAGRIFYDFNLNGIKDSTDVYAAGMVIQAGPAMFYASSTILGQYNAFVDSGNYFLTLPVPPTYYSASPGTITGYFQGAGNIDTTHHFALQPQQVVNDLKVIISATTVPRPGFAYPLHVTYRNIGTTTLTGSVELQIDSLLLFQNSTPAQSSIIGNTLSWNFTNLLPTQAATIVVNTLVPATAILGTTIHQTALINPITGDNNPADNTYIDSSTVVGAYDPNDKQVSHSTLTPNQVQNEEWLEYTIRFQNTGTDTAFTVRLADTLSALLNIPTIELLSSSHPYTWNIKGSGILEWRFDNILLPDSNTNEAASHGFVKFRIKPNNDLTLGDVIENTAHIYFDFNEAIITNTTTTEVRLPSSVATRDNNPLRIYPNPSKGQFTVQCNNIRASQLQAEMLNVLGQVVWQQSLPVENGNLQQVVRTNGLSKGVYYLQVKTEKEGKVQKVVLE